jgi:CubicO group peptidase (beta-lactamase class C family)
MNPMTSCSVLSRLPARVRWCTCALVLSGLAVFHAMAQSPHSSVPVGDAQIVDSNMGDSNMGDSNMVGAQRPAAQPALARRAPQPLAQALADTPLAASPRAIDAADLSAYVDGLVEAGMHRDGIAGVTVAVVDRQGPLLLRGYGIAEFDSRRPVAPDRTLFRIASISKTFTYLLGLKLVDGGRLKLDAPVNDYLPAALKLPSDGLKPVLVRHLFTHTAGYEDSAMGHLFSDRSADVLPLQTYLVEHRPARVRQPGIHAVYSNYSVALLGAVVAHVEGEGSGGADFETLAERRLFGPMGMTLTTFREPLPESDPRRVAPRFIGLWSQGFERKGGGFKPQKFEHIAQIAPAGGASSHAADMARYLRMLINGGMLDGVPVLSTSEFARLRGEPLFRNAAGVPGFSYGFFKRRYGQVESLEHGGATSWFHSNFVAIPELGVGIFVSTNTNTGRTFAAELPEKILARYFPQARPAALPAKAGVFDATRFVGDYFSERSNFTTAEKLLLNASAKIVPGPGGLTLIANGDSSLWLPEGGLNFREAEGGGRMSFIADRSGVIVGFASPHGHNMFDRAGFFDRTDSLLITLGAALTVSLLAWIGVWFGRRRRHREHRHRDEPSAQGASVLLRTTAVCWVVFIAVFGYAVIEMSGDGTEAFYRFPSLWITIALWLSPLAMAMSLMCALRLPAVWRAREWPLWRKLRHSVAIAVYGFACWTLWGWNLVAWKL